MLKLKWKKSFLSKSKQTLLKMSEEIKPTCVVQGPIKSRSGYGDHTRSIVSALIKWNKFDIKVIPMSWGACPNTALDNDDNPNNEALRNVIVPTITERPDLFIQISIPNEFRPHGKYNIGITAGIETSVCRGEWVEGLNRMDMNIVPSNFSKEVFEKVSFTRKEQGKPDTQIKLVKPIEVVFEGVNTSVFRKTDEIAPAINIALESIPETFCFLMVGHWMQGNIGEDRKDIGMLVKTFSEVFKNRKRPPALVLKSSGASFSHVDKDEMLKKIHTARQGITGDLPNVYLIHGDLSEDEMNSLYNHPKIKAHVSFTHGEGFGRPLLEASLSGKPVIASKWSGHVDFLPENMAVLLEGTIQPVPPGAVNDWIIKESSWFNVNYSLAANKLNDVFENYIGYIPAAEKLRKQNAEKFSEDASDKLLIDVLQKNVPEFEKKLKLVLPKFDETAGLPSLPKLTKIE
jgi:glycosyltransferase involved in cell wall biosynthesis